jgi:hypothetical protein
VIVFCAAKVGESIQLAVGSLQPATKKNLARNLDPNDYKLLTKDRHC